jgi:PBP1b-binding outer membrane lipoprotein LpoB
MFKHSLILIPFFLAGCSSVPNGVTAHKSTKKKVEFSRIEKKHCAEIGSRAAIAWAARVKAIPGKAIKDKIIKDYKKELIYRGATNEVKNKLLQMTEYVINKAYEWNPPFKAEAEAKIFGKEYCEKNL